MNPPTWTGALRLMTKLLFGDKVMTPCSFWSVFSQVNG